MKKRINFIDITRAIAIILIVVGHTLVHSQHCQPIFKFIYSFHVVLFFIISGYTFKIKYDEKMIIFFKNKFLRIMIPYFIWALLFLIPYMIFGSNVGSELGVNSYFDLKKMIINIIYGIGKYSSLKQNSALWFLPALFSIEIFYYIIIKLIDKRPKLKLLAVIPLLLLSYTIDNSLKFILPWGINTALVMGIFFYIGYLFKKYNLFNKDKLFKLIYILPILFIGVLTSYYNDLISCIDYYYGNLTLALLSGLCLSISFIYIAYLINENKVLEYIGRNTMGILIFHKLIVLVFQTKLGPISNLLRDSNIVIEVLLTLIVTALSIACSLIATEIVRRFVPFVLGEKNKKKTLLDN